MNARFYFSLLFCIILAANLAAQPTLIPYRSGELWGYADTARNIVIPVQFEHTKWFTHSLTAVKKDGKFGLIDQQGEIQLPCEYESLWVLEEDRVVARKEGMTSLMNFSGKKLNKRDFNSFTPFKDGLSIVRSGNKLGAINRKGKVVIEPLYDDIKVGEAGFTQAFNYVKVAEADFDPEIHNAAGERIDYFYFSPKGKRLGADSFQSGRPFRDGFAEVITSEGQLNYLTQKGNLILPPDSPLEAIEVAQGHLVVEGDSLMGLLDAKGKEVLPLAYDYINEVEGGGFVLSKEGYDALFLPESGLITPFEWTMIRDWYNGLAGVYNSHTGASNFLTQDGELLLEENAGVYQCDFGYGYSLVTQGGRTHWIDVNGDYYLEEVARKYDRVGHFRGSYAHVTKDGKKGWVSREGEELLPCQFAVIEYLTGGWYRVKQTERSPFGIVKTGGEPLLPYRFEKVRYLYNGMFEAMEGNTITLWDTLGRRVFEGDFDQFLPMNYSGWLAAQRGDKWGLIHPDGTALTDFEYDELYSVGPDSIFRMKKGKLYGLIDAEGNELTECRYLNIRRLAGDLVMCELPNGDLDNYEIYDGTGSLLLTTNYRLRDRIRGYYEIPDKGFMDASGRLFFD